MSKAVSKSIKIQSILTKGAHGVLNDLIIKSNGVVYVRKQHIKKSKCKTVKN